MVSAEGRKMFGLDYLLGTALINSAKICTLPQSTHTRSPATSQTWADTLNMRTCTTPRTPPGLCWRPGGPPRRVRVCARMLSTGRPAYGIRETHRASPLAHPTTSRPKPKAWVTCVACGTPPPQMGPFGPPIWHRTTLTTCKKIEHY